MPEKRSIVITSALPYANGDIHVGHMVEHFLTDFWSRFQKMRGHECLAICADDTHGTPIMMEARKRGITPEELIAEAHAKHVADFEDFGVHYDYYSSTNTEHNRAMCNSIYQAMKDNGHIETKTLSQAYCLHDKMFLPDRFIKGTCPKCGAEEQYGDQCERCSATYDPLDLVDPKCAVCGNKPEPRESQHFYFQLDHFREFLQPWIKDHTHKDVVHKLNEWFDEPLRDWCISRDEPYFGFEIPGSDKKYFYVWVDAPIGYMGTLKEWCEKNGKKLEDYWKNDDVEIYHNIGKDIIYFHILFWPAMLKNAGWNTPNEVFVHGFLTVNGEKMSKSRGTFINARTYLNHLDPTYLRYYFACKLNSSIADMDMNFQDFVSRVNSDLIGKITNVGSRGAQMLSKKIDGTMGTLDEEGRKIVDSAQKRAEVIAKHFEERNFSKAMLEIRAIADDANKYFDNHEPWKLIKTDVDKTRQILTTMLNLFRIMAIYLKPIIPSYTAKVEALFGESPYQWDDAQKTIENHKLEEFKHILERLDPKKVDAIVEETKALLGGGNKQESDKKKKAKIAKKKEATEDGFITIDDFAKVDLRVAEVVEAKHVEGADKLLQLTLSLGDETKNVFAGIKSKYSPEELKGRLVVMVANLAPRKMKFGLSEGMVVAAGPGGKDLFLLSPDSGAKPGMKIS